MLMAIGFVMVVVLAVGVVANAVVQQVDRSGDRLRVDPPRLCPVGVV
jgi:hypothetical protein